MGSDFAPLRDGVVAGLITFGAVVVSIAFLDIYAWHSQVELVRQDVGRMASAAAGLVDGDKHQLLQSDADTESELYSELIDPLVRMHRRIPDVAYLYTFVERDGELFFGLDTATRKDRLGFSREMEASRVMERYESDSPEMDKVEARVVREGIPYVHDDTTTDDYGAFLTGLAPIFDSKGRPVAAVGLDVDVTHLKSRLKRLRIAALGATGIGAILSALVGVIVWRLRRQAVSAKSAQKDESEARYEAESRQSRLVQALSEIVYHHDLINDRLSYVGSCETLLGLKPSEMDRNTDQWIQQMHPDDRSRVTDHFERVKATRELFNMEYRFRRADGDYIWISDRAVVTFDSNGRPEAMDGVMVNVQDRKAIEEQLRTVFEASTNPHILLRDGIVRNCNAAAMRLLGCDDKARLMGSPILPFLGEFQPDGRRTCEVWDAAVSKAEEDGAAHRFELEILRDSESRFVFEVSLTQVFIDGTASLLSVWQDLTRIKAAQSELIVARDRAESANRAKTEFLAVMSHEIRTPLNGVLGFCDLLGQTRLNDVQAGYLRIVSSCGSSLLTLIDDILDFSRMESGRLELETREFDLHACIQSVTEIHSGAAFAKGVELMSCIRSSLPRYVLGDEQRLRQVFLNLVGNAVKFTASGYVVLRGAGLSEDCQEGIRLEFEIEDTGIGIAEEALPKLFEPFAQADSSMSRRFGGAGLGLVISSRLVGRMNGSISVKSREGNGSLFRFSVVLARSQKSDLWPRVSAPVLIASHDKRLLEILMECLGSRGVTTEDVSHSDGVTNPSAILIATSEWLKAHPDCASWAIRKVVPMRPLGLEGNRANPLEPAVTRPIFLPGLMAVLADSPTPDKPGSSSQQTVELQPLPSNASSFDSLRVLIVEDNLINQKLMFRMLRQFGILSILATGGAEAIRVCQEQEFDIIFMDIQMPGLDGFETTRFLRSTGCAAWIVALTAHAMNEDRERCLKAGMNDFLTKPMRLEHLREVLQARRSSSAGGS